jgi:hypothetical protein
MSETNFENSHVQGNGGAIYNSGAVVTCNVCNFDNCKATAGGKREKNLKLLNVVKEGLSQQLVMEV